MRTTFLFLALCCATLLTAQTDPRKPAETRAEYEKRYERRIQQEQLYGVYIPRDIGDAFNELNKKIDAPSKAKFKALSEADAVRKLYFSFGRWLSHNWSFYEGSRFSHYLRGLGLTHPDDMIEFVIITYHRSLHKKPLDVKPLLERILAARKAEFDARRRGGEVLDAGKRQRERPEDNDSSGQ